MRSFAHAVVLLVILGFVANVAVAVWLTLGVDPNELTDGSKIDYVQPGPDDTRVWESRVDSVGTTEVLFVQKARVPGLSSRVLNGSNGMYSLSFYGGKIDQVQAIMDGPWERLLTIEVGWPIPAFAGARLERDVPADWLLHARGEPGRRSYEYQDALPINRAGQLDWRFMPYRPLPLGFVLNWLLFGVVLSVLFWPFWLRRMVKWYRTPPESLASISPAEAAD